ncbi:Tyrosine-protein kinase etk [Acaryochloris thomasi RCC1774]|uniref:Tyrosine-protein kinase etk n=2 Tax=Acaryochloris TaxID=155977 RepID=A0A2W1JQY7_9CYAN|nr:Tyrosine-protein kinase etk [Acaryochloris thomasi RCC1774]
MRILIESNYTAKQGRGQATEDKFTDPNVEIDPNTQIQILRSSELLQKAIDLLQQDYPDITVEEIQGALEVSPVYGADRTGQGQIATNVLSADYTSNDPAKTQRILQTLLSVFQVYNLEQQKQRLSKGLAFINEQLPEIRQSVLEAEAALQAFRRGENVIDPAEQAGVTTSQLASVKQERESLKAQYREAKASYETLQQQIEASPRQARSTARLSESPRYQALLNQIQTTELELSRQQQQLTAEHPILQDLRQQREEQIALLRQEESRVLPNGVGAVGDQSILSQGQFGRGDVGLANQLTQAQNTLAGLAARDQSLAQTEAKLEAELREFPELIAQYSRLQPEVQVRQATLQRLLDARQELGLSIAQGGFDWQIVEAPLLGEQTSPNVIRNLLLGTVAGLFLGSIAAFVRESLDDTVHNSEDLGNNISLPLLGTLPALTQAEAREALATLPFYQNNIQEFTTPDLFQWKPLREALDLIYANIQLLKGGVPYKSLMVTSALSGEGKSTLSLGLAISASRLDQRVLIIDADLRNPSLHRVFNLTNHHGLSTLLTGDIPAQEWQSAPQWVYMRWDDVEDDLGEESEASSSLRRLPPSDLSLDVLTAGPSAADPVKLLSLERMKEVISAFQDSYDLILVDSPPVLGLVDTIPVGLGCDGVVMVGRMDKITRTELSNAVDILDKLNLIGLVANGVNQPTKNYKYLRA